MARDYVKIKPGDAGYELVASIQAAGRWICDSLDHNEPTGCSNPDCFKFNGTKE